MLKILFSFCWMLLLAQADDWGCHGLKNLGTPVAAPAFSFPPDSRFRNILIVELKNGQRFLTRTPVMAGVRHAQMWDYLTETFGERGKILFAGEEVLSADKQKAWVKDRSRLNDKKFPVPLNESKISNYRLLTGIKNVTESPYSDEHPHLNPILDPKDPRWTGVHIPNVFSVVDIKHDILDEILIGVNMHLQSLLTPRKEDSRRQLQELRATLGRRDFANLLDALRFDGVDTRSAEADIAILLKPETAPGDPAFRRLFDFLYSFQHPTTEISERIELQVLPRAPSRTDTR